MGVGSGRRAAPQLEEGRAPASIRNGTARDMDTALYWLSHPTNTTTSAYEHSTSLITTRRN